MLSQIALKKKNAKTFAKLFFKFFKNIKEGSLSKEMFFEVFKLAKNEIHVF